MSRLQHIFERTLWMILFVGVLFFSNWSLKGLAPEAAFNAGLAAEVLRSGEVWLAPLREGLAMLFKVSPYFLLWGSNVLEILGQSDGAARAIGGIPAALALLSVATWTWLRMGWGSSVLFLFLMATAPHYLSHASSSFLGAPLSLAFAWTAIASCELHWREKTGFRRPLFWALLFVGLMLSTALRGLPGLSVFGGLLVSLALALFFSERSARRIVIAFLGLGFAFILSLIPLFYWGYQLFKGQGLDRLSRGVFEEFYFEAPFVFNFSTSPEGSGAWYEYGPLLNAVFPWGWLIAAAYIAFVLSLLKIGSIGGLRRLREFPFRAWALNALAFVIALVIPYSFFGLDHPQYFGIVLLLTAPAAAFLLSVLVPEFILQKALGAPLLRWLVLLALLLVSLWQAKDSVPTRQQGQAFIHDADEINGTPDSCLVQVHKEEVVPEIMQAYALWYWKGRRWEWAERRLPSPIAVPDGRLYWEPSNSILWGQGRCDPKSP